MWILFSVAFVSCAGIFFFIRFRLKWSKNDKNRENKSNMFKYCNSAADVALTVAHFSQIKNDNICLVNSLEPSGCMWEKLPAQRSGHRIKYIQPFDTWPPRRGRMGSQLITQGQPGSPGLGKYWSQRRCRVRREWAWKKKLCRAEMISTGKPRQAPKQNHIWARDLGLGCANREGVGKKKKKKSLFLRWGGAIERRQRANERVEGDWSRQVQGSLH